MWHHSIHLFILVVTCWCAITSSMLSTVAGAALPNQTNTCLISVDLEWTTRVGSSVYATPLIADLGQNGQKDIFVPTFSQFFEVLRGENGEDAEGFPFSHSKLKCYASPVAVDMNADGQTEWLLALYSGELVVVNEQGKPTGVIPLPPLAVKKNWSSLNVSSADSLASLRVSDPKYSAEMIAEIMRSRRLDDLRIMTPEQRHMAQRRSYEGSRQPPNQPDVVGGAANKERADGAEADRFNGNYKGTTTPEADAKTGSLDDAVDVDEEIDGEDKWWMLDEPEEEDRSVRAEKRIGPFGSFSPEALESLDVLFDPDLYRTHVESTVGEDTFPFDLIRGTLETRVQPDEIAVPAHLLSTPVLADVDGNGDLDAILHVSYFFDTDDKKKVATKAEAAGGASVDTASLDDYVATAVVCLNLVTGQVRWTRVLHVTMKRDPFPSYALSSPLVVNADSAQGLEVYVSTTRGHLTSFTGKGELRPGWPVTLGPMTASPSSADLLDDGTLSICVGDVAGNVGCWSPSGKALWTVEVEGGVADRINFADVLNTNSANPVFGTTAGFLYALDGRTGATLRNFPVITRGPIVAPVLPIGLLSLGLNDAVHLVFPSHDGHVYIVDGLTGCIQAIDIDEQSSSMILADDITGNGHMDLLVTTIRGGVYVFETDSPFSPLKVWPSKTKALNGFTAGTHGPGVAITPTYRQTRDIRGDTFILEFDVSDTSNAKRSAGFYLVEIFVGTKTKLFEKRYSKPGTYRARLRTPLERKNAVLTVRMTLPNGQTFIDTLSLSFNKHFLETVKFAVVIPLFVTFLALTTIKRRHEVDMSSYDLY